MNKQGHISCDLNDIKPKIYLRATFFFLLCCVLEVAARIICLFKPTYLFSRHAFAVSLQRNDARGEEDQAHERKRMGRWLHTEGTEPLFGRQTSYRYFNQHEFQRSMLDNSFVEGSMYFTAMMALGDPHKYETAQIVKQILGRVVRRATSTRVWKPCTQRTIEFLRDIESCSAETVMWLVEQLAQQVKQFPVEWTTCFHNQMRCCHERNPRKFMGAIISTSFFAQEGSGLEIYYAKGYWKCGDRYVACVLNIFLSILIDRVSSSVPDDAADDATDDTDPTALPVADIDSILFFPPQLVFHRFVSERMTENFLMYKAAVVCDLFLSFPAHCPELNWTRDTMDRAAWALKYMERGHAKQVYKTLQRAKSRVHINLRTFDARVLLMFSVTGMIQFIGYDSCIFKMTARRSAKLKMQGLLPSLKVRDLVSVGLVESLKNGYFRMLDFPGCDSKHKGIKTGDRLLLVKSTYNERFKAKLTTVIG